MTVALSTDPGGVAGFGGVAGGGGPIQRGGAGFGAGHVSGASGGAGSGPGSGIGSEIDAGEGFFEALKQAGSNPASGEIPAFGPGESHRASRPRAWVASEAPVAGEESSKANLKPMPLAWGMVALARGETAEEAAGELGKSDAENDGAGAETAGSRRTDLAFAGGKGTRSMLRGEKRIGSAASTANPANSAAKGKQPPTNGPEVSAGSESAAALSATKAMGSIGSSVGNSKFEKRNSFAENTEVQGRATHGANGAEESPIDGNAVQAALPLEASIAPTHLASLRAPGDLDRVGGETDVPAAAAERPAPGPVFASGRTSGAASIHPATAATSLSTGAFTDGQIPIPPAQSSPSRTVMHSEAPHGIGQQAAGRDSEQEEFAAVPRRTLIAAPNATSSAPKVITAEHSGASSSTDDQKMPVAEIPAHRGVGETSEAKRASAERSPLADKPSLETEIESPPTPLARTAHESAARATNAATLQPNGSHIVIAQSSGIEAASMVRDSAGAQGTASTPATIGSSSAGPAPTPQETFAALDAGTTVGVPSWVHTGGRQAEAGFEDPALGWVGVRADLSGGSVHAALVPGSTEAAQALSGHLAGLSTYLSENHTPVATLTMAAPGSSRIDAGPDQGMGQGLDQGMQQNAGQNGEQNRARGFEAGSQPRIGANVSSSAASGASPAAGFDATGYASDGLGKHISVMA